MSKSIISFTAVILVIVLLCCTAAFGLDLGFVKIPSVLDKENGIKQGLDLVGGSAITFEAERPEGMSDDEFRDNLNIALSMMQKRVINLGYTEAKVQLMGERIYVEIPSIDGPEEAVQQLGSTAQLEFRDADGNVVMTGDEIKDARSNFGPIDATNISQHYVVLTLKPEAVEKFAAMTKAAADRAAEGKNYIGIYMDGKELSIPAVGSEYAETGIVSEEVIISGNFDADSALTLAELISAGQLPFSLQQTELRSVGPQLGEKSLETSLFAGLIGIILIAVLMIVVYRLPGVVATFSLIFYIALDCIILAVTRMNLTLPGIAGVILSIGMAVDANVIIFERIKEELKLGKTLKSAIDMGFHRAFTAILDSNITTLIAVLVLLVANHMYSIGTIIGFAKTLGIGVIVSMFTALTVTHFLLNRLVDFKIRNVKFYGA